MAEFLKIGKKPSTEEDTRSSLKKYLDVTKSMYYHFKDNTTVTDLTGIIEYEDTSNVTNMGSAFSSCKNLTSVPLFDTSNVTNMGGAFASCTNLTSVPLFDTSNVTVMNTMFSRCEHLTSVPLFDTSNVTDMSYMFYYCHRLTEVPPFDTSNVTNMGNMFYNCTYNLTSVPLFDTSNVTNMSSMFYLCNELVSLPAFDMRNVTGVSSMFYQTMKLTECWFRNIKVSLQIGSGDGSNIWTTYGHLLTMDSLLSLLNETVYGTTSRKLTVGSLNLAKFTGDYEYVKPTGKYLDLDDNEVDTLTDKSTKIPVVWCSASDEGAMTVADYMASKGWSLA